jgi:TrmH family RNA methyltransferase
MVLTEPIRSRSNPLLRRLRALKQQGVTGDLMLLEGATLVEEALGAGVGILEVAVSTRTRKVDRLREVLTKVEQQGIALRWLDEALFASLSEVETSQGLLAIARRPAFTEDALFRGAPLILVGVSIQNPGNVGALLRVAEAAGATGAYLTAGSADPFAWKALRGAMGSAFRLPCVCHLTAEEVAARLKRRGVTSVATVASGGTPYDRADLGRPLALWLGNEGAGLAPELQRQAARQVTVPMAPPVESLNVPSSEINFIKFLVHHLNVNPYVSDP